MPLPVRSRPAWMVTLTAVGLGLAGCRPPPPPASFPHWNAPAIKAVAQRLLCALDARCERLQLLLLDDPRLNAELRLGYQIVLSRGLIAQLRSEDELTFVIAHELGHHVLGHRVPRTLSHRLPIELEADRFAAERLCEQGRNPASGQALLQRVQGLAPNGGSADSYPRDELQARLAQSLDCAAGAQTAPPSDDAAFRALLERAFATGQPGGETNR